MACDGWSDLTQTHKYQDILPVSTQKKYFSYVKHTLNEIVKLKYVNMPQDDVVENHTKQSLWILRYNATLDTEKNVLSLI